MKFTTKCNVELPRARYSFILLAAQPCKLVGNHNIKLSCSLHNLFPLSGGYIMGNLGTVFPAKQRRAPKGKELN